MVSSLDRPKHVIASGGGLLASPAWDQMMSDALGVSIKPCLEREATSRGAAVLACERLGLIKNINSIPFKTGKARRAHSTSTRVYEQMLVAQRDLYNKLFVENR